ncbi:alpha/beta hydrolase [Aeoliella mucimassa]|uniref:Carboxylesterase NlhH n=1 Tax=Aeoliella mucimassa TaxID=2527972 RepID=A0A518AP98_9BACT|nr:alpha/beta hydrolase [Aeoliella mucimassa]QDU56547.1 Carboxylesterase NlhH [Aeoliella mucimassa]
MASLTLYIAERWQRLIQGCALVLLLATAQPATAEPTVTTLTYKQVGDEELLLDVVVPEQVETKEASESADRSLPVVIVVHGGGWGSGDRKTMIAPVLETLTQAGCIYVSLEYRLSPQHRWPACLDDVQDGVAWTKDHIAEYGGDPDRIAILGYSAGGQLAFWAAIRDTSPHRLKGLIGLAPTTDFLEDLGRRSGPSKALRDLMNCEQDESLAITLQRLYEASPINYLHDKMPPILLIHGSADRSVPLQQSVHIQQKIAEQRWDVPCELYRIEGAPHRQSEWDQFDEGYKRKLREWLGKHL